LFAIDKNKKSGKIKKETKEKILKGEKFNFEFPGKPVDIYLGSKHLQIINVKNNAHFNVDYLLVDPDVFPVGDPTQYYGGYKGIWEDRPLILGRENPYRFELPNVVSRKHLMITVRNDKFEIADLNSTNGTRVEI